ncbi:alpha/beta hydrolase fold domain-containing protein [Lichenicola sp.]|uniref:alpha/beta hydrolase fold domain-containing protein n=1 Tax=Lichenicola sp. TaxID=2804529 RepID=UPI003B004355
MLNSSPNTHVETFHPLAAEEQAIEQSVLGAIGRHFAGFQGSMRDAYDAMTAQTPIAGGVTLDPVDRGGIQGWWVRPDGAPGDRAILFLHGGAYALGSATAYRGFASQVAIRAGVSAFVLDYPLAPEHPFPAAHDAALAARRWLGDQGIARLAVVGDSAGGALALTVATDRHADRPAVTAAVVFSPWVDLALAGASFADPATRDRIFQPALLASAAATYLNGADPRDGRASPLYADIDTLPPLAIQVGSDELLLDDARRYAAVAAEKGGEVRLDVFEGLHHVFQRSVLELPTARQALDAAAAFLSRHWR